MNDEEFDEAEWLGQLACAWHVSPSSNRESIRRHGLDWSLMGVTGGIAAGPVFRGPEMEAVFLCVSRGEADFFIGFGSHPLVDVWQIDVSGLALEPGPDGWIIHRSPIPPERITLIAEDVAPTREANRSEQMPPSVIADSLVVRRTKPRRRDV